MDEPVRVDGEILVGGQPGEEELRYLANEGVRSVINLRHAAEKEGQPAPDREGEVARKLGMRYEHIPVSSEEMDEGKVDRFRAAMDQLERPVYVHCGSGKRAGAFTMMHVGTEQDMDAPEVMDRARREGVDCGGEKLVGFVRRYVEGRTTDPG